MIDLSHKKLGRLPSRTDARTLRMAKYVTTDLQPPPRTVNWGARTTALGTMLNDELGCCTIAAKGHLIQTWTANNNAQVIVPDSAILAAYSGACGYNPADPTTDQGGNMLDVLNYCRKVGIAGHKIFAFVAIDPRNRWHAELAMHLFGGADVGLRLPRSAQTQEVWTVPASGPFGDGAPNSWGAHDVCIVDYTVVGPVCISWGKLITMTWQFLFTYCDEMYGILSEDWANDAHPAPNGFDFKTLKVDLGALSAV